MEWLYYAVGSAAFAGITAILAKTGIRKTDSDLAVALRTFIVLGCACFMVKLVGSYEGIHNISGYTWKFLILSGLATGASWLAYFKALQLGEVHRVEPIEKMKIVFTMLFGVLVLGEATTKYQIFAMILITVGTCMMAAKAVSGKKSGNKKWLLYAVLSAVFASISMILDKIGVSGIESNLGRAIRMGIVLIMTWLMVLLRGKQKQFKSLSFRSGICICLSGITTGLSWLCYYRAINLGDVNIVNSIQKLSIVLTIVFSAVFLKEYLSKRAVAGLLFITAGIIFLLI